MFNALASRAIHLKPYFLHFQYCKGKFVVPTPQLVREKVKQRLNNIQRTLLALTSGKLVVKKYERAKLA